MPQGVKGRLRRSLPSPFKSYRGDDIRRLEDAREFLTDKIAGTLVQFADCRQNRAGRGLAFEKCRAKRFMDWDCDRPSVSMASGFGRYELDDSLPDVDARPIESAAIPKPQAGIDSD